MARGSARHSIVRPEGRRPSRAVRSHARDELFTFRARTGAGHLPPAVRSLRAPHPMPVSRLRFCHAATGWGPTFDSAVRETRGSPLVELAAQVAVQAGPSR